MIYHWNDPQLEALAKTIPPPDRTPNDWEAWCVKVRILLTHHFPSDLGEFNKIAELGSPPFPGIVLGRNTRQADVAFQRTSDNHYKTAITRAQPKMLALLESIDRYHPTTALAAPAEAALDVLLRLLDRFPQVARQLQHRRSDRGTLRIDDEYDVQDLLHALLLIDFEDVRDEEAAPSQGGSSSRLDFLLHGERIVIEVKKTRDGLRNKDLTTQINDDAGRYQRHPDCKTLVCFIYDPEYRVKNPKGFEKDHTRPEGPLKLITIVRPQ